MGVPPAVTGRAIAELHDPFAPTGMALSLDRADALRPHVAEGHRLDAPATSLDQRGT